MSTIPGLAMLPPPVLPSATDVLPVGEDWLYEFLWGGERIRALKDETGVRLISRDGRMLGNRFPRVAAAVARLRAARAVLDGEILRLETLTAAAVERLARGSDDISQVQVAFLAYDVLQHETEDLRTLPLLGRRIALASIVQGTPIILSPFVEGPADRALDDAARLGLRGVVAKRAGSPYRPNAINKHWVKRTLPERVPGPAREPAEFGAAPGIAALAPT